MVASEIVLPCDRDAAWEALTESDWLGEDAVFDEEEPGERLVVWLPGERAEVLLTDAPGGTRVSVFSTPVLPTALAVA